MVEIIIGSSKLQACSAISHYFPYVVQNGLRGGGVRIPWLGSVKVTRILLLLPFLCPIMPPKF